MNSKNVFTAVPDEDQCANENDCAQICIEESNGYTYVTPTSLGDT